ncbi:MAG: poly(A) polymerase [Desulfobacteraceae bacterium]|nr:poly(A) polymerase [Desulfobacteraceae bacterium]
MDDMPTGPEQDRIDAVPQPLIVPRAEHPISRKNIDREALKVLHRLRDAGFTAYLVGGGVRDLLLGKAPKDFDISTDARPGQLRKIFRNSRIIGRRFRLVQVFFHGGKIIEVSTFRQRSEFEEQNGESEVLASDNTFGTPAEDAFRRDLTINALFYEIEHFTVIDYTGGMADLRNRIIRFVGDPDRRLTRDPARMLRAIRHAARSGFQIEAASWEAIKRHRQELALCPVSRIRDELLKDLRDKASQEWLRLAVASGLLPVIFPCYESLLPETAVAEAGPENTFGLLSRLAGIIDRLHREGQQLPDHFLFALFLIPWAMAAFGLMEEHQGEEAHQQPRTIREGLDPALERLNVKRAAKEGITLLLINLPAFRRHADKGGWPKWLRKKSYFQEGLQFFQIYQEAAGGEPVAAVELPPPPKPRLRKRPRGTGGRVPAVVSQKGGIFGLKKR